MNKKLLLTLLSVSLILASCGREETPPTLQTPKTTIAPTITFIQTQEPQTSGVVADSWEYTSIQWVQGEVEDKLFLDSGVGDVDTEVVSVGSPPVDAQRTGNGQALTSPDGNQVEDYYMQFRVDDSVIFAGSPTTLVRIEIEYFDNGTDSFAIQYDALAGGSSGDGTFKKTDPVIKTDSQSFQTAVFTLSDAYFANRDHGADFRISDLNDGAEIIRSVTVTLLPETSGTADIVFYNGHVITMEEDLPLVQAIAIQGEFILAVGTDEEILALAGADTQIVDLNGLTISPGFIEGHTHVLNVPDHVGKTMDEAMDVALSYGLTTVSEMVADDNYLEFLSLAEQEGRLKLRVNVYPTWNAGYLDNEGHMIRMQVWFPGDEPILDPTRMLRIPGIKIFIDGGGQPARGCPALTDPYFEEFRADPEFQTLCFDDRGDLYVTQEELNRVVADAQAAGFRVAFHAMGDRGIEVTLNAIEYALAGESNELYRHQIHHNSLLRPDQLERYSRLGILASIRGTFNTCSQSFWEDIYPERFEWSVNRYALPGMGVHAFAEGDFGWTGDPDNPMIVRPLNPLMTLWGLATHKQVDGEGTLCEPGAWINKYQISVEQALGMLTIEPAFAVSMEEHIGSLKPGKFADLIILSGNPLAVEPDSIKDLTVMMTMVGGKVEYCALGNEHLCPNDEIVIIPVASPTTGVATIIYHNGIILTMEDDQPQAEAIALLGDEVLAVGSDEGILALSGAGTQVIDLDGRTLMPGFVDAHTHVFQGGFLRGQTFEEAQQYALEDGTTAIGHMLGKPELIEPLLEFEKEGKLRIRTTMYLSYINNCGELLGDWVKEFPPDRDPSHMLRFGGIKMFSDGNSCMRPAYSFDLPEWAVDDGLQGDLFITEDEFAEYVREFQAEGYQVGIHSVGDRAIETVLNGYQAALGGGPNTYRHRIEHNYTVRPEFLPRYSELGVIPIVIGGSPACVLDNPDIIYMTLFDLYPETYPTWFNPVRQLLDANPGLPIAWHSDRPALSGFPIHDLFSFVTRKGYNPEDGSVCDPPDWLAAKAVTVEEALRMMTINSAYALFMEEKIGSLKPGKYADLVILSDNPLTIDPDLLIDLQVLLTMVGGNVEFCSPGYEDLCP